MLLRQKLGERVPVRVGVVSGGRVGAMVRIAAADHSPRGSTAHCSKRKDTLLCRINTRSLAERSKTFLQ